MKYKLKPCPYCGSKKIEIIKAYIGEVMFGGIDNDTFIQCFNCGSQTIHHSRGVEITKKQLGGDIKKCVEEWNRRVK